MKNWQPFNCFGAVCFALLFFWMVYTIVAIYNILFILKPTNNIIELELNIKSNDLDSNRLYTTRNSLTHTHTYSHDLTCHRFFVFVFIESFCTCEILFFIDQKLYWPKHRFDSIHWFWIRFRLWDWNKFTPQSLVPNDFAERLDNVISD